MPTDVVLTREELYARVWTTPVVLLATELGLSGPGLAKVCARLAVPVPPRGYWARKEAGRRPRQPALPQALHDTPRQREFIMRREDRYAESFSPKARRAIEHELTESSRIAVPEEIEKPHPLVKLSRGRLRRFDVPRPTEEGVARRQEGPLEDCLNEFLAALIDLAERHRLWQERLERERRAEVQAERRRQEAERRRKIEQARGAYFEQRAAPWQKARAFDEILETIIAANGEQVPREWLAWARAYVAALRAQAVAVSSTTSETDSQS